ncbi:N-acetyltransferase [Fulvivirga imtechensis AK7]|uniref:N-acetyltransferase n=1 Tax=Fulvivirga imtechensis AK7 TaxID=1237149 RepID=L8JTJ8_9BACT|nr:arylamine N-acetyltransferase [Fulvivirga imtechensis]ELR70652.1 N-acetyltransferase [Fulvivirga imtechensis AK7]
MDQQKYLERINYTGDLRPSLEVLQRLQKMHLLSVPFENLDIHYGLPITLDINKIYNKVVLNKRGGFCYELNGLYYELLISIGFNAKMVSARVYDQKKGYGQEYDHLSVVVNLDGIEYLTDVGFGEFMFSPLEITMNNIQPDARGHFMIDTTEDDYLRVNKIDNGTAVPEFMFKNIPREFSEFAGMCIYHQSNPASHFTQRKLISIPTEKGRVTLTTDKLKITENQFTEELVLQDEISFLEKLKMYFKIDL